jgi:energy-coupling factor transport system permease protein
MIVGTEQQIDPRAKLVAVVVISTLAILIQDAGFLIGLGLFTLLCIMYFKADFTPLYKRLWRLMPLFVGLLIIQSIFSPSGSVLVSAAGIRLITSGGLIKGVTVILRLFIIIGSAIMLTTSPVDDIILALVKIKIPYEIAFMVLLAVRFLPILMEELSDALTAIQLRGIEIEKIPLGKKLQVYTYILMPVVAGAIIRAKKVAIAMEARAFRAYPRRTYIKDLTLTWRDYAVITVFFVFGICFYTLYLGRRRL